MSKSKGRKLAEWLRGLNANAKLTTTSIGDGSVDTAKLEDSSITFEKFHDSTVIDSTETIAAHDSDTAIPTAAAIIDYVASQTSGGISNVVEDTTPELGGDLSLNSNNITGAGNINTTGNITITGYLAGPATFTIDPAAVGDNTGTVVIAGNLQVDGNTTTINSTTMTVDDLNVTLASGAANAAAANGAGITVDGASATLTYNSTPDAWSFNKNVGIGTSSPSRQLEIVDTAADFTNIGIVGKNTGQSSVIFGDADDSNVGSIAYDHTTNALLFANNNTGEKMRIDSSGNVIATGDISAQGGQLNLTDAQSPALPASIVNTGTLGNNGGYTPLKSSGQLQYSAASHLFADTSIVSSGYPVAWSKIDSGFTWGNYSNTLMTLTSSGNVGIGTDSPDTALDVTSANANVMRISRNDGASSNFGIHFDDPTNDYYVGVASASGAFSIGNNTNLNTGNYLTIDSSGNVGINNPSPTYTFEVTNNSSAYAPAGRFLSNSDAANWARVDIENVNAGVPFILYQDNNGAVGVRNEANQPMFFSTNAQTRMTIDASGNVGIGTSSINAQLQLTGDIWTGAGTAASPAVKVGDGNTGLYYVGGNVLGVSTNGTERMRIDASGNVGIGNSPTDAKVFIEGVNNQGVPNNSIDSTLTLMTGTGGVGSGGELRFAALGNSKGQAAIKTSATNGGGNSQGHLDFYIRSDINDTSMTRGMRLSYESDLVVTGNVTAYSDERLKSDIETLDGSKVYEMRGVSFTKDGAAGSGVIAQELQKVAPELVHEGEEYLSVAYGNLVGYLIEAVKELKAEIDELKRAK